MDLPESAVQTGHAALERAIRAELDGRFPLINGLTRGEYEAISHAAADAVVAALPNLEQHLRAKIADEIEALADGYDEDDDAYREAARVARGQS